MKRPYTLNAMFGVQIVPESALPRTLPHVTIHVAKADSSKERHSKDVVSLDELIEDTK